MRRLTIFAAVLATALSALPALAAQDDAGSGGDAGDTFATATSIVPQGLYRGRLERGAGDRHDYFRFRLEEGERVSVRITVSENVTDPMEILDPNGVPVDTGMRAGVAAAPATAFTHETDQVRLGVHRAVVAGEYRLHLSAENRVISNYTLCFWNCEQPRTDDIQLIFGGSLAHTDTQVLLVPPSHGDLGNPLGPTVTDYIDATLRGIHRWTDVMHRFADDYPAYDYLKRITIEVEVFDGVTPVDPAGFDVLIGYVAAGPVFRGVASDTDWEVEEILRDLGLDDDVHYSGRVIALSLFGAAPRAGQILWDFPEVNDLEIVTIHEFGHTFGLGHTLWWDEELGPDLMNSPATFIYGDGFPVGDGGERTPMDCLSTLDMAGMAELYDWIPSGRWRPNGGSVGLPRGMPYRWYC